MSFGKHAAIKYFRVRPCSLDVSSLTHTVCQPRPRTPFPSPCDVNTGFNHPHPNPPPMKGREHENSIPYIWMGISYFPSPS